jgi:hypothetical protein
MMKARERVQKESVQCVHHWLIESPKEGGKMLAAICRRCGAERMFSASFEDQVYEKNKEEAKYLW